MEFPALDVVFALAMGAIDFFVNSLATSLGQIGHVEARVAPWGPTSKRTMTRRFFPHDLAP